MLMLGTSQHVPALRGTMALFYRYHPIFFPLFNQKALLSSLYPYDCRHCVTQPRFSFIIGDAEFSRSICQFLWENERMCLFHAASIQVQGH